MPWCGVNVYFGFYSLTELIQAFEQVASASETGTAIAPKFDEFLEHMMNNKNKDGNSVTYDFIRACSRFIDVDRRSDNAELIAVGEEPAEAADGDFEDCDQTAQGDVLTSHTKDISTEPSLSVKLSQYKQSTQAAVARAADAQARVQKFLAEKSRTTTKATTPIVLKRSKGFVIFI